MDYFQKLTIFETFRRVGDVFSRKYAVFLSITVLAYLLFFAASVMAIFISATFVDYNHGQDWSSPHFVVAKLIDNFVFFTVMALADGAIIRTVTEMYVGQVPTVDATMQYGLHKVSQLLGNACVIGLAVGVPAILLLLFLVWVSGGAQVMVLLFDLAFIAVALFVTVVTYHTYAVIMVEEGGIIDSIHRSVDLSQGYRWHIFAIILIFGIAKFILYTICNIIARNGGAVEIIFQLLHLCVAIVFASLASVYVFISFLTSEMCMQTIP